MEIPRENRAELIAKSKLPTDPSFEYSSGESLAQELESVIKSQDISCYIDMKKREVTRDAMDALFFYVVVTPDTQEELTIATYLANLAGCAISESNYDQNKFMIATGR
jgi:hypothetical protein